jgi:4-amino-4-deoxy-L-arabinose transferase-like glycosyltransferase
VLRPEGQRGYRQGWAWLACWIVVLPTVLILRPLLPLDETRYLSVAWEMWQRGDWLVPHLNGAPYSDKPPLLFWCILVGWRAFGVNLWWPRLLSPVFAVLVALLLSRLARRLAPERDELPGLSVLFLSATLWVTYSTLVLFDPLLNLCVLIGLSGLVAAWDGRWLPGWLSYAAGLGLGILAKGPVVLIYLLPVALLAPWWAGETRPALGRWYFGLMLGIAVGLAIGLSWALAAGPRGGAEYQSAILWDQTAGRMVKAFAHRRPVWWYLPLLPLALFPWALWPPLWRALAALRRGPLERTARFALAIIVPGFLLLSLLSGKQVHYLMPLLPGFALLASAVYAQARGEVRRWDIALPAGALVVGGFVLLLLLVTRKLWWGSAMWPGWAALLILGGLALMAARSEARQLLVLSLSTPALLLWIHFAGRNLARGIYDLAPPAKFLSYAEQSGRPIAFVGRYSGQFHFLGQLRRPFDLIKPDGLAEWARQHPGGLVIRLERREAVPANALRTWPYRDGTIAILSF